MPERRTEDSSIAPRRSLGGKAGGAADRTGSSAGRGSHASASSGSSDTSGDGKAPVTERVGAVLASAGDKIREAREANASAGTSTQYPTSVSPSAKQPATRARGTRRARLRLTRLDPWSVMKTAFLLSIAFGIVTVVAVGIVWGVLGAAGVWDSINSTVHEVLGNSSNTPFDIQDYIGTSRVMGFTMIVAVVDVLLITAIATLGAFLYNLAAALLGGVEVTLAEDDR